MSFFDVQVPMFKPLWRRVVVTVVCLGWMAFELASGEMFWAILFGAAGLYLFWQFFVAFDPKTLDDPGGDPDSEKDQP